MKKLISCALIMFMCAVMITVPVSARDLSLEESMASDLKALGLFKGVSDTDFDLDREPTRVEAIVMLIRVLGKENDAMNASWSHPFTDVPAWADGYVGYAYENGLTKGVSATEFGSGTASSATFITFVLRALGYSDTNGADFSWNDPYTLADSIGILPERVNTERFWRSDVAAVSYAALSATLKDQEYTLADKLVDAGVFTGEQFYNHYSMTLLSEADIPVYDELAVTDTTAGKIYTDLTQFFPQDETPVLERYVPVTETKTEESIEILHSDSSMTAERIAELEGIAVFWAPTGTKIHDGHCQTFGLGVVYAGTMEQAQTVREGGLCKVCAKAKVSYFNANPAFLSQCYTYEDYLNKIPYHAYH